ncbi:serine/threonine-protein kinase [Wenjunlia vitaminophila]|uniref:serine/threonine-protein kinase n=1 Tax=Wenjunlia vitaminophila TaxID=76728 RepID=UPI0003A6E440|nr:serine/threonine-protein kinase [Wenjunlia vitaminophila]
MSACQRPNCSGTLEDDGLGNLYCDTCGMAPEAAAAGPRSPVAAATAAAAGSVSAGAVPSAPSGSVPSRGSASSRSVPGRLSGRASHSVSVRSARSSSGAAARRRLGAGLVSVPAVPRPDPRAAVLENPEVRERSRFCGSCEAPVGRGRAGRPGRTEGFCTKCGNPYSFVPRLRPGDVVHGQYEVVGCLAHGGLGWIYLAVDHAVDDKWVVLKGLLDTGDPDALAVAVAERRFLAQIDHPNIVGIINFVEHRDPGSGSLDGYIVMDYVGGKSLKDIANERRTSGGRREPMPVEQAIAYALEVLDALGYLHDRGLVYCDFKIDNVIQQEDRLKLIDLGAVRRLDDQGGAIYGTVGYQAPEIAEAGPSVSSDLYTVARTLAVLTFDFSTYTTTHVHSLPEPDTVEVFSRYESFYRLLVRATDPDPQRRFASADEMAEQLTGVLREVVALQTGQPRPAASTLFGPETRVVDTDLLPVEEDPQVPAPALRGARRSGRAASGGGAPAAAAPAGGPPPVVTLPAAATALALPVPRPSAGFLAALAATGATTPDAALESVPPESVERRIHELRARLEANDLAAAEQGMTALEADCPDDWRVVWYRGLVALSRGDHGTAALSFDAVYDAFPGEPAPKLALGVCAELLDQWDNAAEYYRLVWSTDRSFVSAAFGLARVRLAVGDRGGAVRALESIPEASTHYTAARVAAVRARLRKRSAAEPLLPDLTASAAQIARLELDPRRREALTIEVLGTALEWLVLGGTGGPGGVGATAAGSLLGSELSERGLRFGLERSYRVLARLAQRSEKRIELVDRANQVRPRTWV